MHLVFHGLRIYALVHAPAEEAARGTFGNFLPAERTSPAAPSLHAQEFQRGAAVCGYVLRHVAAALESDLRASARPLRAGRSARREESVQNSGGGEEEDRLS